MGDDELSPPAVFSLLVNTCMGIGFLAIPYSTLHFGLLAAVFVTLGLGAFAVFTALWVTTTLSLTWALTRTKGDPEISSRTPISSSEHNVAPFKEDNFDIGRSVQMSYVKMIGMLYGDVSQKSAMAALALVLVISMWSFAAIFASSMAATIPAPFLGGTCDVYDDWADPACASRYYLYLIVFAVLMVALSLVQLREQKVFQLAMTVARIVLGLAIIGDCIRMLASGEAPPHPGGGDDGSAHVVSVGGDAADRYQAHRFPSRPSPWHVEFHHAPQHIALATAALTVHMVIPDAVHDLAEKRHTLLPTVGAALAFCTATYCLLSATVVLTFGVWTRPVCTLNWVNYTAGEPVAGPFAIAFRSFIILIPVLDVTAAYPILAQSLASNLHSVLCCEDEGRPEWYLRLSCAMVPLLGAAFVYDAAETLGWCGVLLVPFVFVLPQLMLIKAERLCIDELGEEVHKSPYWRWYCDRRFVWTGLVLGSVLSLLSVMQGLRGAVGR